MNKIKRAVFKTRRKFWKTINFGTKFKGRLSSFDWFIVRDISEKGFCIFNSDVLNFNLPEPNFTGAKHQKGKDYLYTPWERPFVYDKNNPFMALSENKTLMNIASAYLGYNAVCNTIHLAIAKKQTEPPHHSQLWHRDPDDRKVLKIFLYLNDVNEKNGALQYVKGGHCTILAGRKGTIIFAETTGFHRGGYVTEGERKMLTLGYVTRASGWEKNFIKT